MKDLGFRRVAVVSPRLKVADVDFNLEGMLSAARQASEQNTDLLVYPELALTGYSCGDLFFQSRLQEAVRSGLMVFCRETAKLDTVLVVGLPWEVRGRLYNCAAVLQHGRLLGMIPKVHLPNRAEFYEGRWFASGAGAVSEQISVGDSRVPFGIGIVFRQTGSPEFCFGVELCEDLWAVEPPSGPLALSGATVLVNLSASTEVLGKADYRRDLVRQQSARCLAAYLYASAGPMESTSDVVYSGHGLMAENGRLLGESKRFSFESELLIRDIDVDYLRVQRWKNSSFANAAPTVPARVVEFAARQNQGLPGGLQREVSALPFVPSDPAKRRESCREIFDIQSTGLARRLLHTGLSGVVVGISGGLDSTLALLVCVDAFQKIERDPAGILGVTMPGPGTTGRTKNNALQLLQQLGVTGREISITAAVEQHLADIGHPPGQHDTTYENAQARERTQILMDLANQQQALVVGTGDLSEAALGWCTFNGDHMSMYHVNIGVPKTLVRYLVEWCADERFDDATSALLRDICATPITPELLPVGQNGELQQETEALIGPYELHDFFLYHAVHCAAGPDKVRALAQIAFADRHTEEVVSRWLEVFYRRFFSQQFKRNAMPDGPKVGTVALSPRGDLRMPSDASPRAWLVPEE